MALNVTLRVLLAALYPGPRLAPGPTSTGRGSCAQSRPWTRWTLASPLRLALPGALLPPVARVLSPSFRYVNPPRRGRRRRCREVEPTRDSAQTEQPQRPLVLAAAAAAPLQEQ